MGKRIKLDEVMNKDVKGLKEIGELFLSIPPILNFLMAFFLHNVAACQGVCCSCDGVLMYKSCLSLCINPFFKYLEM